MSPLAKLAVSPPAVIVHFLALASQAMLPVVCRAIAVVTARQQANAAAQKVQSSAEQAQNTATQAQQSATEAERLADQASANAVQAKTALSIVNGKSQDENKKISELRDVLGRFRFNGDIRIRGESFFQDCAASGRRPSVAQTVPPRTTTGDVRQVLGEKQNLSGNTWR